MHYYQHNIADFNNATRHLTRVERSLYRDMIEMYYDKEQPLPLDENQLFRRVLAITDEEKQAVKNVLADFFVLSDEGWRHERCDTEIEAYHAKQEQQSRAGKASAAKRSNRKHTTDEPTNNQQSTNVERPLNDCSTTDEPTNNHKPITNNHKPIEEKVKKEKAEKPKAASGDAANKRGKRLQGDWSPSQALWDWTFATHPNINAQRALDEFHDYWAAKSGRDAVKLDWDGVWRNRVRQLLEFAAKKPTTHRASGGIADQLAAYDV